MARHPDPPHKLPDAYYTARKIKDMCRFIEDNRSVRINKVSLTIIHNLLLASLKNSPSFSEEDVFKTEDPSSFYALSVFHSIYLQHYREQDFASLDNFHKCFIDFQHYLWEIADAYCRNGSWIQEKLPRLKLFDVKNMDDNLARMQRWNYEWRHIADQFTDKMIIEKMP